MKFSACQILKPLEVAEKMSATTSATATQSGSMSQLLLAAFTMSALILAGCSKAETNPTAPTRQAAPSSKSVTITKDQKSDQPAENSKTVSAGDSGIRFSIASPAAGFVFRRFDDMQGQHRILEVNGGGVGILDIDHDGWSDIFMTNGCRIPVSLDQGEHPGVLFRNHHGSRYVDVNKSSGVAQTGLKFGCAVADYDNDGFDDFYLTAYGGNQLWASNGDGTFSEIAASTGTECGEWGSSAAWGDLNGDGSLDLYVANYLKESDTNPTLCPDAQSPDGLVGCSPAIFEGVPDRLFLSDGMGAFIDASESAGLHKLPGKALGVVICDLCGDATPEIYVANDGEANFLFTVESMTQEKSSTPLVRLSDIAIQANAALNELGYAQAGMGVIAADFDRSGALDIFLTHFYGDTNTLYLNRSSVSSCLFEDATRRSALGPPSRSKLGFGTVAADFNCDGWEDIAVANGHVDDRTWMKIPQPFRMNAQVFANAEGRFNDVSDAAGEYFRMERLGRGLASADLNRDGREDLIVSNQLDEAALLYNESQTKHPVARLRLIGTPSTRCPIGTAVRVRSPRQDLKCLSGGGSFQSTSAMEISIPLENDSTKATIVWPSGDSQDIELSPGDSLVVQGRPLLNTNK